MKETGLQVKSFIEASTNVIQPFTNGLSLSSMRNRYCRQFHSPQREIEEHPKQLSRRATEIPPCSFLSPKSLCPSLAVTGPLPSSQAPLCSLPSSNAPYRP
ncbi:hypothetical protein AVEN_69777-1 [Araneus ventricosus]|uniref:Uncharacterized protein n=1 Tax=Araneus ventricosus TaxID=182803 RepID=A0A4Y2CVP5_ARAVE|nr:hypothetical protein AVEN_69777-1 [Araneus ventricosus]